MNHLKPFSFPTILATSAALLLVACSGEAQSDGSTQPSSTASSEGSTTATASTSAKGDCDLLDISALNAAVNNQLTFTKMSGYGERGAGCTVSIVQGEESQLILQVETAQGFAARKNAYESQGQKMVAISGIGREAWLFNDAQLIAVDDQGRAISLALQLIVFGGPLPIEKEEVAAAIETIGRDVMGKL